MKQNNGGGLNTKSEINNIIHYVYKYQNEHIPTLPILYYNTCIRKLSL